MRNSRNESVNLTRSRWGHLDHQMNLVADEEAG